MAKNSSHNDDQKLLRLYYKKHDQKWLGILLERYTLLLFGVCMKYLKDENEAQDTVQQVFLKTLSVAKTTRIRDFGAWIYQVTRNECYTRLRQSKNILSVDSLEYLSAEPVVSMKEWMAEDRKFQVLEKAIEDLRPAQKHCILLFYFEKKSYQEIATLQNMTVKEVKSHIQNGKRNLKIRLEPVVHKTMDGDE